MSSKDSKKLLLEARESIKNKDYVTVQKKCKEIISTDKGNYNAWVFLGIANQELQDLEKSLAAFNKAIGIAPENPLAWQGLRSYYEKESPLVHVQELIDVYAKLLEFYKTDQKKLLEAHHNIALLYFKNKNDLDKALEYLWKALEVGKKELTSENAYIWCSMVRWLTSRSLLPPKKFEMLTDAVAKIFDGLLSKLPELADFGLSEFDKYLEVLFNHVRPSWVHSECKKLLANFGMHPVIAKWILRCYVFFSMEKNPLELKDFDALCSSIPEESQNFEYVGLAKGARAHLNKDLVEARTILVKGLKQSNGRNWEGWLLICQIFDEMRDAASLLQCTSQGIAAASTTIAEYKHTVISHRFSMHLGKSHFYQGGRWEDAIRCFKEIPSDSEIQLDALYFTGLSYLQQEKLEDVLDVIKSMEDNFENRSGHVGLLGMFNAKKKNVDYAKEKLKEALMLSPNNSDWLLELGILHWHENDVAAAYDFFMKAAKADRYNSKVFLMLGHHFKKTNDGLRKAQRCYKQAYELYYNDDETGICLSDCYQELKDEEANMELLTAVTSRTPSGVKWAWFRLGLLYLRQSDPNNAIMALQRALRTDPLDSLCWECLAESYLVRGSNNAALKAFNRALEIDPTLVYSKYQIAGINLSLGQFKEAADMFKKILDAMPLYVPALKGLGEAYIALARVYLRQSLGKMALSYCEAALIPLARALGQRAEFTCLWKLLGDACTLVEKVPDDEVFIAVPSCLVKGYPEEPREFSTLDKRGVLSVGCRCYLAATRWQPNNSSLWHDIGVNCYHQAVASDTVEKFSSYSEKSTIALKKAISLKPTQTHHWSALGVVASSPEIKNYDLAQHSFVRAVKAEPNNEVAWTNLGALYLIHRDIELANGVFNVAQSIEPSYINCWVGQAQCAEMVNSKEAMDLFRHCTNLGHHLEGASGYATWVCSTLKNVQVHHTAEFKYNIEQMGAVSAAIDCLSQYKDLVKNDPCIYNMLGMLLERQGLFKDSAETLKRSLKLLQAGEDVKKMDKVRCNYARVLRNLGDLKQSVEEAVSVKESEFYNHCGLASSYNQLNMLEESVSNYETALQWLANTEEEKSHLMVVMASMTYAIQGPEHAKTLLFQSFEMKPLCVQGVLALGALGILLADVTLTNAALAELKPLFQDERYVEDIYYIRAWLAIIQGDNLGARSIISRAIHCYPAKWSFWKMLSVHLLQRQQTHVDSAIRCALSAAKICATPLLEILQLLSLCYYLLGRFGDGLAITKKLIHCYPGEKKNWLILTMLYKTSY